MKAITIYKNSITTGHLATKKFQLNVLSKLCDLFQSLKFPVNDVKDLNA